MPDVPPPTALPAPPSAPRWIAALVVYGPALVPLAIGLLSLGSDLHGVEAVWWPVAAVAVAGALVVRTRHPVGAWVASMAVVVSGPLADNGPAYVLLLVVPALPLIALAMARPARWSVAAALVTVAGLAGVGIDASPAASESASVALKLAVALPGTITATAWLIGYALRTRAQYQDALVQRARWLERERDARAAQAVAEDRIRIARELHDVVGHHVTVMVVQAEAADAVWDAAPDRARAAVGEVAATGREAMRELRETLRLIREPVDDAPLQGRRGPDGLRGLGDLVERVRGAGLDVDLDVRGDLALLDPAVDLAALRTVQEALTNVLRHAGARRATVEVVVGDELHLRIADDGVGLSAGRGSGRGLAGMRERVAAVGGTVTVAGAGAGLATGAGDEAFAGAGAGAPAGAGDEDAAAAGPKDGGGGAVVEAMLPLRAVPAPRA